MMQRLAHINPKKNEKHRHLVAIGEINEHYLVLIRNCEGYLESNVFAVRKKDYVVFPSQEDDNASDLI